MLTSQRCSEQKTATRRTVVERRKEARVVWSRVSRKRQGTATLFGYSHLRLAHNSVLTSMASLLDRISGPVSSTGPVRSKVNAGRRSSPYVRGIPSRFPKLPPSADNNTFRDL